MKHYKYTFLGGVIAVALFVFSSVSDIDLFEWVIEHLHDLEQFEIDELIIPLLIFSGFASLDYGHWRRQLVVMGEKEKLYKGMISAVHHVLNNFLNQMHLFKFEAEKTEGFDPEVLAHYDSILAEASSQVAALSNLDHLNEQSIHAAVFPKTGGH